MKHRNIETSSVIAPKSQVWSPTLQRFADAKLLGASRQSLAILDRHDMISVGFYDIHNIFMIFYDILWDQESKFISSSLDLWSDFFLHFTQPS